MTSAWMQSPNAIVFVLAGQSNMAGSGNIVELDEALRRQPANIEFYLGGKKTTLVAQQDRVFARLGSIAFDAGPPDRSHQVRRAPSVRRSPRTTEPGLCIRILLSQVRTITEDRRVELGAVFWMQGERDARYPAAAAEYEVNFATLIERLRRDLDAPGLPFIYGRINPSSDIYPGVEEVRLAQNQAEERFGTTKLVSTDDLPKLADGVHYDARGQMILGRRFAEAYIELRK